jgi:hypothetical protein
MTPPPPPVRTPRFGPMKPRAAPRARDPVRVGLVETDGRAVEGEDRRLLELSAHLLADEEAVLLLVGVQVEVLRQLVVPVDLDVDRLEGVQARVGVAREEVAVGARGLPEEDAAELHLRDPGQELDVLKEVGEIVDDQRVRVLGGRVHRLDHGLVPAGAAVLGVELLHVLASPGLQADRSVLHRCALALDRDARLRPGLRGVPGRALVQVRVELGRGAQERWRRLERG